MKKLLFLFVSLFAVQVAMADEVIASYTFPNEDLAAAVSGKSSAITADPYTAKGKFFNCSIGMKNVGGYSSKGGRYAYINDKDGTYYHKLGGDNAYIRFALASGSLKADDVLSIVLWNNSDNQGIALGEAGKSSYDNATITIPNGKAEKEVTYTLTAENIHDGSIYIYRQNGKANFGIKKISIIRKSEIINPTTTDFETIARFKFPDDTAIGGEKESCSDDPFTGGTTTNCSVGLYKIGGENSSGGAQYYSKNSTIYNKFGADDAYIKITLTEGNFAVGDMLYARIWLGTGNLKYGFKFGSTSGREVYQSETWSSTTQEYILAFELTEGDFSGNEVKLYRCTKNLTDPESNGMGGDKFGVQEIWINREVSKVVSIGSTGYATFSGATYDYAVPAGCEAFVASSFAYDVITISKIVNGIIPANTGVLLKGAKGTYTLKAQDAAATVGTNLFKANVTASELSPTEGDYTNFILVPDGEGGVKFAKVSGGTLGAYKAYLQLPTSSATARELSISFDEGETTGISAALMNNERMNNEVYNLAGQRVAQPTKGLYIVNGKKYIVK